MPESQEPHPPSPLPSASTGESTRLLLQRARSGDERAHEELYARFMPQLRRWASGRLPGRARSLHDTDDLVQEALLQTLKRVDTFDSKGAGAFFAYLRQAVMNRLRDQVRRGEVKQRAYEAADQPAPVAASPLEDLIGRETLAHYEEALGSLSDSDRVAVTARLELNLEFEDLAEAVGSASAHAARMKFSRALTKLAREMARLRGDDQ